MESKAGSAATPGGAKSVASILIVCLLAMMVRSATGAGESATELSRTQQELVAPSTSRPSGSAGVEMIEVLEHVEVAGATFGSVERGEDGTQHEGDDESLLLVN